MAVAGRHGWQEWQEIGRNVFAGLSLLTAMLGFMPLPGDGEMLRVLLRPSEEAEQLCAHLLLWGQSIEGSRPRDLDTELVRKAAGTREEAQASVRVASGRLHLYNFLLDSGRIEEAAEELEWLLTLSWPPYNRPMWYFEAARNVESESCDSGGGGTLEGGGDGTNRSAPRVRSATRPGCGDRYSGGAPIAHLLSWTRNACDY